MIIGDNRPVRIIGYPESSMTMEFWDEISKTHQTTVIDPEQLTQLKDHEQYQYIIAVWKLANRLTTIRVVDDLKLDLVTVIHDSVILGRTPPPTIGAGSFVYPLTQICLAASVGKHCIIDSYCLVGHFCQLGDNCQLRPGVMINGKSKIGNNCTFNTRATITNRANVTDGVELLAFANLAKDITQPGIYAGPTAKKFNSFVSPNDD